MIPEAMAGNISDTKALSEAAQGEFFAAVMERTQQAERSAGARTRHYGIGGLVFRLIFASSALEEFACVALAHLEIQTKSADATFHIWDTAQSGVGIVEAPCGKGNFTERGDIWGMTSRRFLSAYRRYDSSLNLFDTQTATGIFWVSELGCIPYVEYAAPFGILFGWAFRQFGRHVVPAAAVANERGAALLVGNRAERSSLVKRCREAGMRILGDRFVVVAASPKPHVFALYGTAILPAKPRPDGTLPNETSFPSNEAVVPLSAGSLDLSRDGTPLRSVLSCERLPDGAARLSGVDPVWLAHIMAAALTAVYPGSDSQIAAFPERLLTSLPAATLGIGPDGQGAAEAIGASIAQSALPPPSPVALEELALSVIIPAYNGAHLLADAVGSVLAEAAGPLDIIVVDDGSQDDIAAAVAALPVPVRLIRQANAGPSVARNQGIAAARFDVLAFLDVDDLWPKGRLAALQAEFARQPSAAVVRGRAQLFRRNETDGEMQYLGAPEQSFQDYIGAALFRRAAFAQVGQFDPDLRYGEDRDWFNRARESGTSVISTPIISLLVRRHEGNMTRGRNLVQLNQLRVFHKHIERLRRREASSQ